MMPDKEVPGVEAGRHMQEVLDEDECESAGGWRQGPGPTLPSLKTILTLLLPFPFHIMSLFIPSLPHSCLALSPSSDFRR